MKVGAVIRTILVVLVLAVVADGQRNGTLWGDFKVEGEERLAQTFHLILYNFRGEVIGRQPVANNGRYRFLNLAGGEYELAIEADNQEIARVRVLVTGQFDTRHDLAIAWRAEETSGRRHAAPRTVAATETYARSDETRKLYDQARQAARRKDLARAIELLAHVVGRDPQDFEAWTDLATLRFQRGEFDEADQAYRRALEAKPTFSLALLNFARLRVARRDFAGAIELLQRAVEAHPRSVEAHELLGETYLQVRKGSQAVVHLNEALRLDPLGRAELHLRLAALYDRAGAKWKAAEEYAAFLAKRPDHPDRDKLRRYIEEHGKR